MVLVSIICPLSIAHCGSARTAQRDGISVFTACHTTLTCRNVCIQVRAIPADKAEARDTYQCPVYATEARFRQEIFTAQMRTKGDVIDWTLRGVALFLDVV